MNSCSVLAWVTFQTRLPHIEQIRSAPGLGCVFSKAPFPWRCSQSRQPSFPAPSFPFPARLLGASPNSDTKYWHHLGKAIPWLPWCGFRAGGGSPSLSITTAASTCCKESLFLLGSSKPSSSSAGHKNAVLASCGGQPGKLYRVNKEGGLLSGVDALFL